MRAVRGFTPLTPCVFNNQLVFFCRILRWWTVFRWSTLIWIDLRKYGNLNCVFTSLPFIHCYGDNGGLKSYKPTREGTDKPWELVMRRSSCRLSWTWTKILDSTEWEHLKPESVEGEKNQQRQLCSWCQRPRRTTVFTPPGQADGVRTRAEVCNSGAGEVGAGPFLGLTGQPM